MKRAVIVAVVFALLGFATSALAQTKPNNPREGTFAITPEDHAQTTKYTLGFFLPGATDPVQAQDIGKPPIDAAGTATFTFNSMPLAFGYDYTAKVKAVAGAIESVWSDASNPFDRTPGKPGKPVIK